MNETFSTSLFEHLWIPAASSERGSRHPGKVMIVLHGRGDSLDSFRDIQSELGLEGFDFLVLNAPWRFLGGYSWGALSPKSTGRILEIRSRLFRLVEEFKREGYSTRDIYWLGHSQGALIASDLVLHHPEAFGAMIGVSGYVWLFRGWQSALKSSGAKRTPWLFTHGSRDRVIPLSEIRNDVKALTKGRVPVSMREFNKGHDFDYEAEVPFIGEWIRHASMELNS